MQYYITRILHIFAVDDGCLIDNGGCEQMCTNSNGSTQCSCEDGYVLAANNNDCDGTVELASAGHSSLTPFTLCQLRY